MAEQHEKPRRSFSEAARREAIALTERVAEALRGRPVVRGVTIDAPTSRDLDDAIWLEREEQGGYRLDISIADVGAFVTPELTPDLDQTAFQRSFTRYFAQGNAPMLPRQLSEYHLSLLEGQPRPTITLSIPFDAKLHQAEPIIRRTVLTSSRRLSYQQVDTEIAFPLSEVAPMLQEVFHLAQRLYQLRRKQGALALYDLVAGWATTEEGVLFRLPTGQRHQAHLIIQECMILANQTQAHYLAERGIPALYRNHAARAVAPQRQELRDLLESAVAHPEQINPERVRATVTLALERACYAPTVAGHFGLNLPAYLHSTSPLRRYADLINQRILAAVLQEAPLPYSSRDLEAIATRVNAAEEEMKEAKLAYFRGTYDEQLRGMIASGAQDQDTSARPLGELDAGHFHSVLRMAAEAQVLRPDVEYELLRRLGAELLGAHDLFTILFRFQPSGAAWEPAKQASLAWLQNHPHVAPSLLVMGQQSLGWGEPHWEITTRGQAREGNFQARAQMSITGQQYTSSWHTSNQKARAKQVAGAELLARIAGVEITPAARVAPESTQKSSPAPASIPSSEAESPAASTQKLPNYKGQLQERTHNQGWDQPTYRELERAGPPHAPTFSVEVSATVDGRSYTAEGTGPTKLQAEQQSAGRLLQALPAQAETPPTELPARARTQAVAVLQEMVQRKAIRSAAYSYEQSGPPHSPTFTCRCVVTTQDSAVVEEQAQGSTKKVAAQSAAFLVLSVLLPNDSLLHLDDEG